MIRSIVIVATLVLSAGCTFITAPEEQFLPPLTSNVANSCATIPAMYTLARTEVAGGTCGALSVEIIDIHNDGSFVSSTGLFCPAVNSTQTGCTSHAINCISELPGGWCAASLDLTFVPDGGTATGLEVFACGGAAGTCKSSYQIVAIRQ